MTSLSPVVHPFMKLSAKIPQSEQYCAGGQERARGRGGEEETRIGEEKKVRRIEQEAAQLRPQIRRQEQSPLR